jgi:hypothetical protein
LLAVWGENGRGSGGRRLGSLERKPPMPINTSSAKAKGRRLQNYVRDRILEVFPWLGEGDVDSCSMGSSGIDVPMSPIARRTFPVSIECKKTKKTPSIAELNQSRANAYGTTLPVVIWCPHGVGHKKSVDV